MRQLEGRGRRRPPAARAAGDDALHASVRSLVERDDERAVLGLDLLRHIPLEIVGRPCKVDVCQRPHRMEGRSQGTHSSGGPPLPSTGRRPARRSGPPPQIRQRRRAPRPRPSGGSCRSAPLPGCPCRSSQSLQMPACQCVAWPRESLGEVSLPNMTGTWPDPFVPPRLNAPNADSDEPRSTASVG
jgi:hypothetical protein